MQGLKKSFSNNLAVTHYYDERPMNAITSKGRLFSGISSTFIHLFCINKFSFLVLGVLFLAVPSLAIDDIPHSMQSSYTGEGLGVGLGIGVIAPSGGDCNCIGLWQAHVDYFYLPYLSGGAGIRFYGGNIDDHRMVIYQRYQLHIRLYKKLLENLVLVGSPLIGFETTDLKSIKQNILTGDPIETDQKNELLEDNFCSESFALNGFSSGFDAGIGYKINKDWGSFGDVHYEYNFSDFHYIVLSVGSAFNLRNHSQRLMDGMLSSWLSFEIHWQRYLGTGDGQWSKTFLLGLFFGV